MKRIHLAILWTLLGISGASVHAEPKPAPALPLLVTARQQAKKENKAVMVIFHASWCGWCKRLEAAMAKPQFKKLFADNYVIVTLDVSENGEQKKLENPGGAGVMANLGGSKSGLPFYAFVDAQGKKLADSNAVPGANGTQSNIGYPSSPAEIAAFDGLLRKTAPRMNSQARQEFIAFLSRTSPALTPSTALPH